MASKVVQVRVPVSLMTKLARIAPKHLAGARERQVAWLIERETQSKAKKQGST